MFLKNHWIFLSSIEALWHNKGRMGEIYKQSKMTVNLSRMSRSKIACWKWKMYV
jgi:hypothetical protein